MLLLKMISIDFNVNKKFKNNKQSKFNCPFNMIKPDPLEIKQNNVIFNNIINKLIKISIDQVVL